MTNVMKTAAYIVLVLGIIGSIILGVISKSFWVFLLYGLVSFMSCLTWFVLVEISEKIDYISEQVANNERQLKKAMTEGGNGSVSNSKLQLIAPVSPNVGGKWTCPKCDEVNSASQRTCRSCGHTR